MTRSREHLAKRGWRFAAAVDGRDGVICYQTPTNQLGVWSSHGTVTEYDEREKAAALCDKALGKLGFKRDRRYRNGWRQRSALNVWPVGGGAS